MRLPSCSSSSPFFLLVVNLVAHSTGFIIITPIATTTKSRPQSAAVQSQWHHRRRADTRRGNSGNHFLQQLQRSRFSYHYYSFPFQLQATKKRGGGKGSSSSTSTKSKNKQQGFGGAKTKTKTTEKKKRGSENNGGAKDNDNDDDYASFPRLDPDVEETLVPSPSDILYHESGVLPDEVYERLEYIYGFDSFNRNLSPKPSANSPPLQDLLLDNKQGEEELPLFPFRNDGNDDTKNSKKPLVDESDSLSTQNMASLLNELPPFADFRVLHMDPLVLAVDDFFTEEECDRYVKMSLEGSSDKTTLQSRSPTVGKDSASRSQRTSTTWYHYYSNTPELMAKATKLVGLSSMHQWEEPQTVRYRRTEKFTWHMDALGPEENRPNKGGQRIATLLVYLTDLTKDDGGATLFRDLKSPQGDRLAMIPKKGSALLFFPAAGGIPNVPFDIRTLHCGQAVTEQAKHDKWIAQLWLCENNYTPTAPDPQNVHANALTAIAEYCKTQN